MTLEDFLAWEARQEVRHEFDGFEPVAMPGGSLNHARLQRNLAISIGGRLRGTPFEFLGSDMKLVSATRSRYPDAQVVCGMQEPDMIRATVFERAGDAWRNFEVEPGGTLELPEVGLRLPLDDFYEGVKLAGT